LSRIAIGKKLTAAKQQHIQHAGTCIALQKNMRLTKIYVR
jgi:hypothetical protein